MGRQNRVSRRIFAVVICLAAVAGACSWNKDDGSAEPEPDAPEPVALFQPAAAVGADSFSPSLSATVLRIDSSTLQSGVAAPDAAGLYAGPTYGGTGEQVCDVERMISFLTSNPDRGHAWADVQGIPFEELPAFLRSLTPVYLQQNVGLTMYGFRDGQAYGYDAILEAGTAVLIDDNGLPRARCACGNPLVVEDPGDETTTTVPDTVTTEECVDENDDTSGTSTPLRRRRLPAGSSTPPDDQLSFDNYPHDDRPYDHPADYTGADDEYPQTDPTDPCSPDIPPNVFSNCLPLVYSAGEQWLDENTGRLWTFNGMVNGEEEWSSDGVTVYGVGDIPGYPWERCAPPAPRDYPCPPEQPQPLDRYTGDPSGVVWMWMNNAWYGVTADAIAGPVSAAELPGIQDCDIEPAPEPDPGEPGEVVACPSLDAPAGVLFEGVVDGEIVTYESMGVTDLLDDFVVEPFAYSAWQSSDFAAGLTPTFNLPGYAERCLRLPPCPSNLPEAGDLFALTSPATGRRIVLVFVNYVDNPDEDVFDQSFGFGGIWVAKWGATGEDQPIDMTQISVPMILGLSDCIPPCPPLVGAAPGQVWMDSGGHFYVSIGDDRWKRLDSLDEYDSLLQIPRFLNDCANPCANTGEDVRPSAVVNDDGVPENPEGVIDGDIPVVTIDPGMTQGNGSRIVLEADPDAILVGATTYDFCDPDACPQVDDLRFGDTFVDSTGRRWMFDGDKWFTFLDDMTVADVTSLPGFERCLTGDSNPAPEDACPDEVGSDEQSRVVLDSWPGVEWVRFTNDLDESGWGRVNIGTEVLLDERPLVAPPYPPCIPIPNCPQLLPPEHWQDDVYWPNTSVAVSGWWSDATAIYRLQYDSTWLAYGFDGTTSPFRDLSSIPSWVESCYEPNCAQATAFRLVPGMIMFGTDGYWYRNTGDGQAVRLAENPDGFHLASDRFIDTDESVSIDSVPGLELCSEHVEELLSQRIIVPTTTIAPTNTQAPATTHAPPTTAANPAPVVSVSACSWSASSFHIVVTATDNTGVQGVSMTFNGQPVTMTSQANAWSANLYPNTFGNATTASVVITATDTQGANGSLAVTATLQPGAAC